MRQNAIRTSVVLGVILLLPALALLAQQVSSLLIDGQPGQARVIQVQGKNYVEVDALAWMSGGSLRFVGNQIILTLPRSSDTSSQALQPGPTPSVGYSKPFLAAGIEAMREILEWHAAFKSAIERGFPLSGDWLGNHKRRVEATLQLVKASASTEMDQKAFPLLVNEFNTMAALTDKYLQIAARRDYIAPDSLRNDPLERKLLACWQSLEAMASSGQFVDDGSCR
jgi:hypothetical protein